MRNTSGEEVKFNYYDNSNYYSKDSYARTSPLNKNEREQTKEAKQMAEFLPVHEEYVTSWMRRSASASHKLTEHARYHHIFGTSKTWACHTSSRYCFICELCNFLDMMRTLILSLTTLTDLSKLQWSVNESDEGTKYSLKGT